jgi:hypothetical protein
LWVVYALRLPDILGVAVIFGFIGGVVGIFRGDFDGQEEFKEPWENLLTEIDQLAESSRALKLIRPSVLAATKSNKIELLSEFCDSKITPSQTAGNLFANQVGDELETGKHHLYRGILTPLGKDLMSFYVSHLSSMAQSGQVSQEWAEEQIKIMRENVQSIG